MTQVRLRIENPYREVVVASGILGERILSSVAGFTMEMTRKLELNAWRSGWHADTVLRFYFNRLRGEIGELRRAIKSRESINDVRREAADVANFAMMIADVYERKIHKTIELPKRKVK